MVHYECRTGIESSGSLIHCKALWTLLGQKKKIVMLPSPDQNLKIGSVGRFFFFYFFFLRTVRELSFPIIFLKFLNGENSGGMQSKRIYTSAFLSHWSKFFAQIWHFQQQKKKTRPCFFAFYGRSGEGQHNKKFFGLIILALFDAPHGNPGYRCTLGVLSRNRPRPSCHGN